MKLIIVSDSILLKNILKDVFSVDTKITVINESSNLVSLAAKIDQILPDLVLIDSENPDKDILSKIFAPIILLVKDNKHLSQSAGNHFIYLQKPELMAFNDLVQRKKFYNQVMSLYETNKEKYPQRNKGKELFNSSNKLSNSYQLLIIGASTGGPPAVASVLKGINKDFPLGLIIVQHIETGFDSGYAEWLTSESGFPIRMAHNDDFPNRGEGILAPTDKHLKFIGKKVFIDDGPKVLNQKPSVDVLFESAADVWGVDLISILLTGMGSDGANGCVKIKNKGGTTIVQDKESSMIYGMPKSAIEKGGASYILPLKDISDFLWKLVK